MKKTVSSVTGIISFVTALLLYCGSLTIKEYSYDIIYWVRENILKKGSLITTEAALIVALLYAVVTYIAVVLLITSITQLFYKKTLCECLQHQTYRYFAFFAVLPLLIVGMGWDIMWACLPFKAAYYHLPLPTIDVALDLSREYCEPVLFLVITAAIMSVFYFSYDILVNSNKYLNSICAVLWVVYAYFIAYIIPPYFEYGKWFLIFVALCYLIGTVFVIIHKKRNNESPLIPKYEITIVPLDEVDDEEIIVDEDDTE